MTQLLPGHRNLKRPFQEASLSSRVHLTLEISQKLAEAWRLLTEEHSH